MMVERGFCIRQHTSEYEMLCSLETDPEVFQLDEHRDRPQMTGAESSLSVTEELCSLENYRGRRNM